MNDTAYLATLAAAFAAGIAGSSHCFAMCGGMASAIGLRIRATTPSQLRAIQLAALYHVGRVGGYALVGAVAGTFGHTGHWVANMGEVEGLLRIAAGMVTLLIAVRVIHGANLLAPLERVGARLWRGVHPLLRRASLSTQWYGGLLVGLLWGWLPCGLVYSMLLVALTSSSPAHGAGVMTAFGAGTLPLLLMSTALTSRLPISSSAWLRRASGALLVVCGLWMILASPLLGLHHHVH
jgi:uncharacterized protein